MSLKTPEHGEEAQPAESLEVLPHVYALGDCCACVDKPLPALAQVAPPVPLAPHSGPRVHHFHSRTCNKDCNRWLESHIGRRFACAHVLSYWCGLTPTLPRIPGYPRSCVRDTPDLFVLLVPTPNPKLHLWFYLRPRNFCCPMKHDLALCNPGMSPAMLPCDEDFHHASSMTPVASSCCTCGNYTKKFLQRSASTC